MCRTCGNLPILTTCNKKQIVTFVTYLLDNRQSVFYMTTDNSPAVPGNTYLILIDSEWTVTVTIFSLSTFIFNILWCLSTILMISQPVKIP